MLNLVNHDFFRNNKSKPFTIFVYTYNYFVVSHPIVLFTVQSGFCRGIYYFQFSIHYLMGAGLLVSNMYGCCFRIISKVRIYDPFLDFFQFLIGVYLRFWRLGPVTFTILVPRAKYVIWIIRNQPDRFRLLQLKLQ